MLFCANHRYFFYFNFSLQKIEKRISEKVWVEFQHDKRKIEIYRKETRTIRAIARHLPRRRVETVCLRQVKQTVRFGLVRARNSEHDAARNWGRQLTNWFSGQLGSGALFQIAWSAQFLARSVAHILVSWLVFGQFPVSFFIKTKIDQLTKNWSADQQTKNWPTDQLNWPRDLVVMSCQ